MVTTRDIKDIIRETLDDNMIRPAKDVLSEAYVRQPKEFELPTELLSQGTKDTHRKLYKEYVQKLNALSAELDTVDRENVSHKASAYRSLKTAETHNRNAALLHELYFANISDVRSEVAYDTLAYMKLAESFGTFDDWQWDFIACALSARSGWAVTAYDIYLNRYVNFIIDGHDVGVPAGCIPILVMDMWEHAFFKDFEDDREKYLNSMMREIDWDVVEKRVQRTERVRQVYR